jgi:hypothetical protein
VRTQLELAETGADIADVVGYVRSVDLQCSATVTAADSALSGQWGFVGRIPGRGIGR